MVVEMFKEKELTIIHLNILRLDVENVELVYEKLSKALNKTEVIILNLSCMNYMDSSGLGAILNCYRDIKAAGNELRVVNESVMIQTLFELVYIEKIFGVYPDISSAINMGKSLCS